MMGVVGAVLITSWAWGLARGSAAVLLDRQGPRALCESIRAAIEDDGSGDRLADLHVWSIGPALYAAELAVISDHPLAPGDYRAKLPPSAGLAHVTVEVSLCPRHA